MAIGEGELTRAIAIIRPNAAHMFSLRSAELLACRSSASVSSWPLFPSVRPPTTIILDIPGMEINAERLAYWYFRLNGFLTIPGFVVHPDRGQDQETDVDLIGMRLPYRAENLHRPMQDDSRFTQVGEKSLLAFVEVKAGGMRLNGPWTNRERNNMFRLLSAVGPFQDAESRLAAKSLYESGVYSNQLYQVTLVCMGARANEELMASHPRVPQITWHDTLRFIYGRFRDYRHQKRSHGQWDEDGKNLWRKADSARTVEAFVEAINVTG